MSFINKSGVKNITINLITFLILIVITALFANAFQVETPKDSAKSEDVGAKYPDHIEVFVKILTIDPIKGDVTARLEFLPHGKFVKEDGTLARTIKFDINSSNGKQEVTFEKGKRMTPTEAILDMYDGSVTDYPFDRHTADLTFYFTVKPDKPADKPKPPEGNEDAATKLAEEKPADEAKSAASEEEEDEVEVPIALVFNPALAGFNIESAESKESDDTYVDVEIKISRPPLVVFFSIFVMVLMWGVSIAVLFLVLSVVFRGRKVEIAMFSFIATLIFAFIALRNSQPAVPPIGISIDYLSFILAEVLLALCLLTILFTWLLRPAAK